jgi:POT family proton-dependent oligopeptide transporter
MVAARNGFSLDHAKPEYQQQSNGVTVSWNDSFVEELKMGLHACRVM